MRRIVVAQLEPKDVAFLHVAHLDAVLFALRIQGPRHRLHFLHLSGRGGDFQVAVHQPGLGVLVQPLDLGRITAGLHIKVGFEVAVFLAQLQLDARVQVLHTCRLEHGHTAAVGQRIVAQEKIPGPTFKLFVHYLKLLGLCPNEGLLVHVVHYLLGVLAVRRATVQAEGEAVVFGKEVAPGKGGKSQYVLGKLPVVGAVSDPLGLVSAT